MQFYRVDSEKVVRELGVTDKGLTHDEVKRRQQQYGLNQIIVKGTPLWKKIIEPFANAFMIVLIVAAGISIWHHDYIDAGIIAAIVIISAIITWVQQYSTEKVLRSLRDKTVEMTDVIRAGRTVNISAEQLVPGDIILLSEGQKIPADARLITVSSLRVDESQLTGESLPISKQTQPLRTESQVYEQTNMVFQGSFVVGGTAKAIVVATGNSTEFGTLAALSSRTTTSSPVQNKIDALINKIVIGIIIVSILGFVLARGQGMDVAETLKFVIAMAVSAVPEDLPVATSVILALGMHRMAAKKALVRTMSAIETLGTLTTIATDKTGTLTKNKLTVQEIWQPQTDANFYNYIAGSLNDTLGTVHDPLDVALREFVQQESPKNHHQKAIQSFPFDQSLAMSGNIYHFDKAYVLRLKGSPEKIIALSNLSIEEKATAKAMLEKYAGRGFRVIAVASIELTQPPESLEVAAQSSLDFHGLIAIADVLRPEAKAAIQTATRAGITVRMITGDHFETAFHIGKELGMVTSRGQVFDCREMKELSDSELEMVVEQTFVFARVVPEDKHRLLTVLKKHNITAMTGDGVNDVPALTNAHVGLAMGSGSSIAKDAGDIILLNDNFKSVVDAIREGRTIFANIKRMVAYLLASNMGEVIINLGALVLGMPIPLIPVQILWVNLVTDTSLVIPLGLEPGSKNVMKQPPTPPKSPLFDRRMIARIALIAITVAVGTLGMYAFFLQSHSVEYARTIAFATLVAMQWGNALSMRSEEHGILTILRTKSRVFWIGLSVSIGLQIVAILTPLHTVLHIASVSVGDLLLAVTLGFITPVVVIGVHKVILKHVDTHKK